MTRGRIDVHCHYTGGVARQLFEKPGYTLTGGATVGQWTLDGALTFMESHGIASQILSLPLVMPMPADDPSFAGRFARDINKDLSHIVKERPDRFGAFATVPLNNSDEALAEIRYALDELGLDGVVLPSNAGGHYLGQPFWESILAELESRSVPVFVHPADCPCIEKLGFGRASSVIEYPFDTARNITNAIYTGVLRRYPGLKLILAHGGGALPTLGWRIAELNEMERGPTDAHIGPEHIGQVLRGLYYEIALAGGPHSLLPVLQVTSHDHILFGTDYPAAPPQAIERNTAHFMASRGLDDVERAGVERANAEALFPRFRSESAP